MREVETPVPLNRARDGVYKYRVEVGTPVYLDRALDGVYKYREDHFTLAFIKAGTLGTLWTSMQTYSHMHLAFSGHAC